MEPDEFGVITDFGNGAHARTRGFHAVALLNGDGRRDALNAIRLGFVHAVQELARVGGKRLDIAALALGEERLECQGAFARAAEARDSDQFAGRQVQIKVAEVVLPDAAKPNGVFHGKLPHAQTNSSLIAAKQCLAHVSIWQLFYCVPAKNVLKLIHPTAMRIRLCHL